MFFCIFFISLSSFHRVRRTEKILDLLSEGFDVLVSDFDALWIDDPLPIISKFAYGSLETISSFLGPQIISVLSTIDSAI